MSILNKKNIYITIIVLILISISILVIKNVNVKNIPEKDTSTNTQVNKNTSKDQIINQSKQIVEEFFNYLEQSAPPTSSEEALNNALSLFSEGALTRIPQLDGKYSLSMLLGIQDIPDQGIVILDTVITDNPATDEKDAVSIVVVDLKYSGGPTRREFTLVKINTEWKIDNVKQVQIINLEPETE